MPSSILTLGSHVFFLQDRNARHFFPGLYQEHCLVQEREPSDSSVLIIDAQEDKATSSILPANIRKLSNATDAVDAEDAVAGTARKRRKTQRALEADVGSMRNTRRKTAANANKENLPQRTGRTGRSGRVAPTEAAGQRGQGTKGTKGTKGTASRKPPRAPSKNRQPVSYADLRADARMLAIPGTTASSRRTHAELTQAIVNHIPDMTVAQLIQVCHKKRLSLETLPRAPRKKDYVTLLVHHYS
jgi:hypothetical protein